MAQTLSIVIPAYNEENTIIEILTALKAVVLPNGLAKELVIVDDCSKDDTLKRIEAFMNNNPSLDIKLHSLIKNGGKGGALHKGFELATGDFIIIQDADLEYDPNEYALLLRPMLEGKADVVYGSRFIGGSPHRILFFWHTIGNKFLTFLSNMFTNLNLTDMETCYKLFRADILKGLTLKEKQLKRADSHLRMLLK